MYVLQLCKVYLVILCVHRDNKAHDWELTRSRIEFQMYTAYGIAVCRRFIYLRVNFSSPKQVSNNKINFTRAHTHSIIRHRPQGDYR